MATAYTCTIGLAGSNSNGSETPAPQVYFTLSDTAGPPAFTNSWFYAANSSKNQMLAVALAAVSIRSNVYLWADPPNAANNPMTQVYSMYIAQS
jgi:hypothetical protein